MIPLSQVAVVIPAYEAADTLPKVLKDLFRIGVGPEQIWVVDDGSPDKTAEVAGKTGVNVIIHQRNKGKGAAHKRGFKAAVDAGYKWVMTMDADTQHDVAEAERFLQLDPSRFDLAIGTRRHNMAGMPFDRWFINRLTSMVLSVFGGSYPVTDSQCGYRLISAEVMRNLPLRTDHFDTESELVARALQAGYRIIEVPITTLYNSPRSHINPLLDTLRFVKLCFTHLIWH